MNSRNPISKTCKQATIHRHANTGMLTWHELNPIWCLEGVLAVFWGYMDQYTRRLITSLVIIYPGLGLTCYSYLLSLYLLPVLILTNEYDNRHRYPILLCRWFTANKTIQCHTVGLASSGHKMIIDKSDQVFKLLSICWLCSEFESSIEIDYGIPTKIMVPPTNGKIR